jgi:hypothetical protein
VKYSDNLSKSTDREGRQILVVAAAREGVGRFIVRADEKLTAFMELELADSCRVTN